MQENATQFDANMSVRQIFDQLLQKAAALGASDLHIDPKREWVSVSMRVDGMLQHFSRLPNDIHAELIACIKISAGLRTDLHTLSQDGRFEAVLGDDHSSYNIRVSIVYTYFGENAVLRMLKREETVPSLTDLGFNTSDVESIQSVLQKHSGLILVTGPTGSGKTTTLHSMLHLLCGSGRNIITIEDPIEYILPEAKQIQISVERRIDFAGVLKSILRQDPNVIMLGEIRDKESAEMAMQIALTGHLILSTIHAIDALNVLARLKNMGIDQYLVSATLSLVISQRLVRRICKFCRKQVEDSEQIHFVGNGCMHCLGKGFRGRTALFETLVVTAALKIEISSGAHPKTIEQKALESGFKPKEVRAQEKIEQGIIVLEDGL